MLCALNILAIVYIGKRHPDWAPTSEKYSWKERWHAILHGSIIEIFVVFIISMRACSPGSSRHRSRRRRASACLIVTALTGKTNFKKYWTSLMAGVPSRRWFICFLPALMSSEIFNVCQPAPVALEI
jgi:TRAP-type C4-dicarboxylate transport system permease large subunit